MRGGSVGHLRAAALRRMSAIVLSVAMLIIFFFFQAEDGIRDYKVTGVQTCALPIYQRIDRPGAKAAVAASVDALIRKAHALGGSMEYVHGIGVKLGHLIGEELGTGADLARRIKGALDPEDVLNPGKLGL